MAKPRMTLRVPLPEWPVGRAVGPRGHGLAWRREIFESIGEVARARGVQYLTGDAVEVEVELYLDEAKLAFHDVDNILKHVFDALQGRLGGEGKKAPIPGAILPNDHQIQRVTIVKKPRTSPKAKSRLIVRDFVRMERVRGRSAAAGRVMAARRPG